MFKRLAEEIKLKCKVCKIFRQQLKGLTEFQILLPVGSDKNAISVEDETEEHKMFFDHTLFKTRQDRFPKKAKVIALKKPARRTEDDIKYLCSLLQTLQSSQCYSRPLQMLLAKVFRFERFGHRRVIIRKGHVGSSFYFIYSGSVAICSDEDGSSAFLDQEPLLLHKGAKFGDIGLTKGQRRNATVVCMSETEFLVVDKKDFFVNKLDEQLHKEFEYRFDFFRSLDIFSHWPQEHIKNISENCQARKFQYGQLIINDTRESNSMAFISEGTCEVLRLVKLINCPSYHRWLRTSLPFQHRSIPQELGQIIPKHPKDVPGKSHQSLDPSNAKQSSVESLSKVTTELYAQKLSALKEAVGLCCLNKRSLQNTVKMCTFNARKDVDAAVVVQIDVLHDRDFLFQGLQEPLLQDNQKDKRSLMLVSKGCKIILLKMEKFNQFCDTKTIEKLQKYQKNYSSDDILCKFFLQQNDWKMFKRDLVNLIGKPHTTHQAEKKRTTRRFQPSPSLSQSGILDLCSTPDENQETCITLPLKDMYLSTQERNPSNRKVHLVHEIVVPRPRIDRILY